MTQAMDVARGGKFEGIPDNVPAEAWYSFTEPSCSYECQGTEYIYWTVNAWVGLATLVLVVTCIGYVLLARLLQQLPISRVVFYYYLVPPVAIIYAIVLFGEIPSAREIVGVAVVIGGVVIALSTPATTSTNAAPSGTDPLSR